MIHAYHVIFTTYGFWLPNDPRGSWSDFVGAWELVRFGKATKVTARRSLAHTQHDATVRRAAKRVLKHEPVIFSGLQALAVSRGFARAINESDYTILACAILPDHVHAVIARHERRVERIVSHLKARATQSLKSEGLWPDDGRPTWAEHCWKVYLNTPSDIRRAVKYVNDNPLREDKRRQRWSFVVPYI
jgi:REP element-mobilizing transposase RayT